MKVFVYLEGVIAEKLGISTASMRKGRKLFLGEGADWSLIEYERKKRVAYSADGVRSLIEQMLGSDAFGAKATASLAGVDLDSILQAAGVGEAACVPAQEAPARLLLNGPWECPAGELVVERLTLNKRIMMCRLSEAWVVRHGFNFFHRVGVDPRGLMRVKVRSTAKFIKDMPVECRHVESDLWESTQRLPRWKGRY